MPRSSARPGTPCILRFSRTIRSTLGNSSSDGIARPKWIRILRVFAEISRLESAGG